MDADGLHIGQSDLNIHSGRKIIGYDRILGVSTHTIVQARKAQQEGADYISVSPIFPTPTKDYEPPVGLDYLKEVKREITMPFVAIGAINLENLNEILLAGGLRVAICSAIILVTIFCKQHDLLKLKSSTIPFKFQLFTRY